MNKEYFHSVILRPDLCTGCTVCMQNCPTQAIRIIDGKAKIISEKCIDCCMCLKVCPYNAKTAITDSLIELQQYKYNIALPSLSFYAQFSQKYSKNAINLALKSLGFEQIIDVSYYAEVLSVYLKDLSLCNSTVKPIISTYCPAVTRLIQIKNPELIKNISRLESPMEVAARHVRNKITEEKNISENDIGIFLLSPCPAKITSIKNPIGIDKSSLDGALSIKELFPKILKILLTQRNEEINDLQNFHGELWGRVGGQSKVSKIDKSIVVDGIEEVSKILDMIELGKLDNIDFIEAYSCVGGCVGGPLNVENPFIAKYRIDNRSNSSYPVSNNEIRSNFKFENLCWNREILPSKIMELDNDISIALKKMEAINALVKKLPGIDCGACGSPSCRALAEDVVQNRAKFTDCIFKKFEGEENEN